MVTDTRNKILDVAEDLIQRVGCNAMSYKHISEIVGIRKASIHHHFPKKENLIDDLLERCQVLYGNNYKRIVEKPGHAPDKLRELANVFKNGLKDNKLCLVGTISADLNTLQNNSRTILEATIQNTVKIFTIAFKQGREDGSLSFEGTDEQAAFAFFSFLLGVQIAARVHGGKEALRSAAEILILNWEK